MSITKDNWKSYLPLFIPLCACIIALIAFYYQTPLIYATKDQVHILEKQVQALSIKQEFIASGVEKILDKLEKED